MMAPLRPRIVRALPWTAATGLYTALTLLYLRPIWRFWGDRIAPSLADPLLVLYMLKWSAHQIRLGLPDLWNANLFYPTHGSFALSDHLLGPAALSALFPNAIAGYNFLFLTSFVASALAVCWVMRRAGLSWPAALLAGWMYTFSSFRIAQMSHLQLLLTQWIPPTLWFWDRLLAERTSKNAGLFLLFYLLHVTGGCYLAYMIHFPLLVLLANRMAIQGREVLSLRSLRLLVPVGLIAGAALLAIFLPYARVSKALGLARTDAEVQRYGAAPASYFTPARDNLYFGPEAKGLLRAKLGIRSKVLMRPESSLFAGFLPTALFFLGAIVQWRRRRDGPPNPWERGLALSGLLCFALTFPIVYTPLMRVIPGMSGMRVPARFYAFVSLALVHFAGRGVDFLRERMPGPRARLALAVALGVVLAAELMPRPLKWMALPREEEFPPVYRWIAREPAVKSLIELPIHKDPRECMYLYYSTLHWKPIANGFSGYLPESHERLTQRIRFLPDQAGLDLIREYWISHLVVHARSSVRQEALRQWEQRFARGEDRQVELVHRSGTSYVYRVLDSPSSRTPKRAGL
ncbi:MAG TPA: hypothetical protein VGG03_25920 [Thermoanaerobaculia bacterium]|jgi:hypothetical protein